MFLIDSLYRLCYLLKIAESQRLDFLSIKAIQENKLRKLVKSAYLNVDYYRKIFDRSGISPSDIQTAKDLEKIPLTSKEDMGALDICEITSKLFNIDKCIKYKTSGTTSKPLLVYFNKKEEILQSALHLSMLYANGYKSNNRVAILTHPQFIVHNKSILQLLGFFNVEYISTALSVKDQLNKLIMIKPHIIKGYAPIIKAIALEIKKANIEKIRPYLVFCTADSLSMDDRNLISGIFHAQVIDYYSSTEAGLIAWECHEQRGHHINCNSVIVELIKNGRPVCFGEEGEIVITNLTSYAMPLIRYKTGDAAIFNRDLCPCGRKSPLIKTIIGRPQEKRLTLGNQP